MSLTEKLPDYQSDHVLNDTKISCERAEGSFARQRCSSPTAPVPRCGFTAHSLRILPIIILNVFCLYNNSRAWKLLLPNQRWKTTCKQTAIFPGMSEQEAGRILHVDSACRCFRPRGFSWCDNISRFLLFFFQAN